MMIQLKVITVICRNVYFSSVKVPADEKEVLTSDLMGLFEKRRFKNFLVFVQDFNEEDPKTWKDVDPHTLTTEELYKVHEEILEWINPPNS